VRLDHPSEGFRRANRRPRRRPTRRVNNSESGQAATEFALILVPMLILVGGIIYFGIGLNYWLDMNKVANQGARWAAVNYWAPYCLRDDNPLAQPAGQGCNTTTASSACTTVLGTTSPFHTRARLQDVLRCQTRNPSTSVRMCYPGVASGTQDRGDPVKVKLTAPYKFWFMRSVGITLTATATMRLEQKPSVLSPDLPVDSC
jgi:TadE-like protein